ncbi:ribosome hibernation-promoting factor, HPF/YfiA family [Candidatus Poribacteria bacterium]
MKVTITGRHIKLNDDIRLHAEEKMHKVETHFDRIIEGHMILSAEKHRRIAEVTLSVKGAVFHAQDVTEDIYASIDGAMEKVDTQIRRHKEKLNDRKHHRKELVSTAEEDLEEEPEIIKVNKFADKLLTPQEAVVQVEISGDDFLMFSNSQTNQVNVIYRRKDGNYGWIEPDFG